MYLQDTLHNFAGVSTFEKWKRYNLLPEKKKKQLSVGPGV